jgi:hypothetical protein
VDEHRGRVENLRAKQNAKATNTLDLPPVSLLLFDSSFFPRYVGNFFLGDLFLSRFVLVEGFYPSVFVCALFPTSCIVGIFQQV